MSNITKTMLVSMVTNTLLSLVKIVVGFIGKSGALIADGVHSFSDLITDLVAIVGGKIASKPADLNHPYGHGKVEYLTSMIISIMIIILGSTIIFDAVTNVVTIPTTIVIYVTLITILAKLLLSTYIINRGKKYKSNILISSGYESRTDVISSVVVLISAIVANIKISGFEYADRIAMIIVGFLIIKTGVSLLKENISTIIGENDMDPELRKQIEKLILSFKDVICVDEIILMKYGGYYKLITEIGMDENKKLKEVHEILEKIEKKIKNKSSVKFITIHVNPYK